MKCADASTPSTKMRCVEGEAKTATGCLEVSRQGFSKPRKLIIELVASKFGD